MVCRNILKLYFRDINSLQWQMVEVEGSPVLGTIRKEGDSDLVNLSYELEDFSERRLWHQLALSLDKLYSISDRDLKVIVYKQFIYKYAKKINGVKMVDYILGAFSGDECFKRLNDIRQLVSITNEEFDIYSNLHIARYYIDFRRLDDYWKIMDNLDYKFTRTINDFRPNLIGAYYLTKCLYCKYKGNYNSFYTNGLLYLSSDSNLTNVSNTSPGVFAFDLAISALLGDKIYNFGELIVHKVFQTLRQIHAWIFELIIHLHSGRIKEFSVCLDAAIAQYPSLAQHRVFLNQKVIIMSLVRMISINTALNKSLTFKEIMECTNTDINDVEHLVIKCFALGLFRGHINQINQVVTVTWIEPRILDLEQIKGLYNHLQNWNKNVKELAKDMYDNGARISF